MSVSVPVMGKKITIMIIGAQPPPYGGGEMMMKYTNEVLQKAGHNCILVNTSIRYYNKDRMRISFKVLMKYLKIYSLIFSQLLSSKVDIVYFSLSKKTLGFIRNIPYILFSIFFRKKVVGHIHGGDFPIVNHALFRSLINYFDTIIVLSTELKHQLEALLKCNIVLLKNGIPDQKLQKLDKKKLQRILYIGNLVPSKGLFRLLDVFISLAEKYRFIELWIIGEWHDESTKNLFYNGIKKNRLEDRFKDVGYIPHEKIQKYYKTCDLLLHPSKYDGQPITIIEALSFGMPVISTNVGGIPLLVKDGYNGFIIDDANDIQAYIEKIELLIRNQQQYAEMAKNALKYFEDHLTLGHYSNNLSEVFEDMFSGRLVDDRSLPLETPA